MSESAAEAVVAGLLAAMDAGDREAVAAAYAEDVRFHSGGDHPFSGTTRSRSELFAKLAKIAERSGGTATMELVSLWPVGDELVVLHLRRHATVDGDVVAADVAMVLRVAEGVVVEGTDLAAAALSTFWTRHGAG